MYFSIRDNNTVIGLVILGRGLHLKLIPKAKELNLKIFSCLEEYWCAPKKEIIPEEFQQLNNELFTINREFFDNKNGRWIEPESPRFMREIEALTNLGKKLNLPIIVDTD